MCGVSVTERDRLGTQCQVGLQNLEFLKNSSQTSADTLRIIRFCTEASKVSNKILWRIRMNTKFCFSFSELHVFPSLLFLIEYFSIVFERERGTIFGVFDEVLLLLLNSMINARLHLDT